MNFCASKTEYTSIESFTQILKLKIPLIYSISGVAIYLNESTFQLRKFYSTKNSGWVWTQGCGVQLVENLC